MNMDRRSKYAMAGWLIPLVMLAVLLWQTGALRQNAAMGYALLLGGFVLLAVCAAFFLLVCGAAWAIWRFVKRRKENKDKK